MRRGLPDSWSDPPACVCVCGGVYGDDHVGSRTGVQGSLGGKEGLAFENRRSPRTPCRWSGPKQDFGEGAGNVDWVYSLGIGGAFLDYALPRLSGGFVLFAHASFSPKDHAAQDRQQPFRQRLPRLRPGGLVSDLIIGLFDPSILCTPDLPLACFPQAPKSPARGAAPHERLRALAQPRGLPDAAQRSGQR